MFFRASDDANILASSLPLVLVPALILSLVITAFVVAADKRTREGIWALVFFFAVPYSYGTVVEINRYLDGSTPKAFEVEVLGRHHESSYKSPASCYLRVEAWGPFSGPNSVGVPISIYNSTSPGQTVCISLHAGALGIPWYVANQCP